jgi:hypothetical protein
LVEIKEAPAKGSGLSDQQNAAKMGMFGRLTRVTHEWHPDRILCKRFNIPDPFPNSRLTGVPSRNKKQKSWNKVLFKQQPSECRDVESLKRKAEEAQRAMKKTDSEEEEERTLLRAKENQKKRAASKGPLAFLNQLSGSNQEKTIEDDAAEGQSETATSVPQTATINMPEKEEKPPLDLFAAIFNDSDSDDEDDDGDGGISGKEDVEDVQSNADVKDEPVEIRVANENVIPNKDMSLALSADESSVSAITQSTEHISSKTKNEFLPLSFLNKKTEGVYQQNEARSKFSCVPSRQHKEPQAEKNESEVVGPALPVAQHATLAKTLALSHGSIQKSHGSKRSSDSEDEWTEQSKGNKSKKKKKKTSKKKKAKASRGSY